MRGTVLRDNGAGQQKCLDPIDRENGQRAHHHGNILEDETTLDLRSLQIAETPIGERMRDTSRGEIEGRQHTERFRAGEQHRLRRRWETISQDRLYRAPDIQDHVQKFLPQLDTDAIFPIFANRKEDQVDERQIRLGRRYAVKRFGSLDTREGISDEERGE